MFYAFEAKLQGKFRPKRLVLTLFLASLPVALPYMSPSLHLLVQSQQ